MKDDEKMHNVLVKLYSSFGFKVIREVGDGLMSVSDRLVWGAVGTLMFLELDTFFKEWTPRLRAMVEREERRQETKDLSSLN